MRNHAIAVLLALLVLKGADAQTNHSSVCQAAVETAVADGNCSAIACPTSCALALTKVPADSWRCPASLQCTPVATDDSVLLCVPGHAVQTLQWGRHVGPSCCTSWQSRFPQPLGVPTSPHRFPFTASGRL